MRRVPVPPGYYVYTRCYPDGTPFYVGVGHHGRAFNTCRNKMVTHIREKIEASGQEVLIVFEAMIDKDAALAREIELIALHGRRNTGTGILANFADGGEHATGRIVSPEVRAIVAEKTRVSKLGNQYTRGSHMTPEQRAHLSVVMTGRIASDETRAKMSQSQRGRPKSPEHREKIRQAHIRRYRG